MMGDVIRRCVKDKENTSLIAFWLIYGLIIYSAVVTTLWLGFQTLIVAVVELLSALLGVFPAAYIASWIYSTEELAEAECRALFMERKKREGGG